MSRTGPLYGTWPSIPSGTSFSWSLDVLLEIAVGRAARHRPDRAHAAIAFVGAALVEERLARRFLGPGEQRADHHRRGARRERLGDVAAGADAAVGDHRNARLRGRLGRRHDRGQLRHADPGDDPRRADRPGPMPTLIASAPASASALAASAVATLPATTWTEFDRLFTRSTARADFACCGRGRCR